MCVPTSGLQNKGGFNAPAEGVALQLVEFLNQSLKGIIRGSPVCLAFTTRSSRRLKTH